MAVRQPSAAKTAPVTYLSLREARKAMTTGLAGTGEQGGGAEHLDAIGRGPGGQDGPGCDGIDPGLLTD
jgi:hypothetical protein